MLDPRPRGFSQSPPEFRKSTQIHGEDFSTLPEKSSGFEDFKPPLDCSVQVTPFQMRDRIYRLSRDTSSGWTRQDVRGSEVDVEGYCRCSGVVRNGRAFALEVKGGGKEDKEVEQMQHERKRT